MDWLLYTFIFFSLLYTLVIILVIIGLLKIRPGSSQEQPTISIVIAAKNEENRIFPLLESLKKIDYPDKKYEVIIVDDASSDHTYRVASVFAGDRPNWQALKMDQESDRFHAKKMALVKGIEHSTGELIFVTDADCRVPVKWLQTMTSHFTPDTNMVIGYSPLGKKSAWWRPLLDFDNLFSAIVMAAPTMMGVALSSAGRNMAFRRDAYDQIGGYGSVTNHRSGDDIHLTEKMRDECDGKITFCADPGSFVYTLPPDTNREIYNQQVRKNSVALDKSFKSVAFSVFLFFALVLYIFLPLINPAWLSIWLMMIGIKLLVELVALIVSTRVFRIPRLIIWLPLMQLLYPIYVTAFAIIGILHLYRWK